MTQETQLGPVVQGDDKSYSFEFSDGGEATDITGWTIEFMVKQSYSDPNSDAVIHVTVTSHDDPTNGLTSVTLPASSTSGLKGFYFYDVQVTDGAGNTTTIMRGEIEFVDQINV